MKRITLGVVLALVFAAGVAAAQLGGAAGGAEALRGTRRSAALTYRVIDGELAKKIDDFCTTLWFDTDEVLLIEYRSRTYLLRTNNPGNIGLACKVM